jgi:hypothetical protein
MSYNHIVSFLITALKFFFFFSLFILGPLAYFSSELIWEYGSYKQSVGLLERVINPVPMPLPAQDKTNREEMRTEWDSNLRLQCLSRRKHLIPPTA